MITGGFGPVAERLRRSTVQLHLGGRGRGSGSGVIWSADGLIVTNAHVARGSHATVELWDGRSFQATVTARDTRRDLASLKVEAPGLVAATSGDSNSLRVGELVMAIGNPLGFVGALSTGVVHALGSLRGLGARNWVQADVRLAPGNSGGPLADAQGMVIGINTMVASGLALAVPSNTVAHFLRTGASGPSLGVVVQPVRVDRGIGFVVLEISAGSPAAAASLFVGDVLIGAGGRPFHSLGDLEQALEDACNSTLRLQFLRGERRVSREVTVRLGVKGAEAA